MDYNFFFFLDITDSVPETTDVFLEATLKEAKKERLYLKC